MSGGSLGDGGSSCRGARSPASSKKPSMPPGRVGHEQPAVLDRLEVLGVPAGTWKKAPGPPSWTSPPMW